MRRNPNTFDDGLSKEPFLDSELSEPKRFFSLKLIAIISMSLLVIIAAISLYFLIAYHQAMRALDTHNFTAAKHNFDILPFKEHYLGEKYAYAEAGILIEDGKPLEALIAFDSLENILVPDSVIDDLAKQIIDNGQSFELLQAVSDFNHISLSTTKTHLIKENVYREGQRLYRQSNLYKADVYFKALGDYLRSNDYQLLIDLKYENRATPLPIYAHSSVTRLIQIAGFEDSADLIIQSPTCMNSFLLGRWESDTSVDDALWQLIYPNYKATNHANATAFFEIDNNYTVSHNLPCKWTSEKSYSIMDGIYYTDSVKQFKFSISNKDTITVFCYKDNSTYTLHRQ